MASRTRRTPVGPEPVQATELHLRLEVSDYREAERWLDRIIMSEGQDHGITAILDEDYR